MNILRKEAQPFSTQVIVDDAPAFGWVPQTISFLRRHSQTAAKFASRSHAISPK